MQTVNLLLTLRKRLYEGEHISSTVRVKTPDQWITRGLGPGLPGSRCLGVCHKHRVHGEEGVPRDEENMNSDTEIHVFYSQEWDLGFLSRLNKITLKSARKNENQNRRLRNDACNFRPRETTISSKKQRV